ncbi:Uncharacterised protein [Mycobacteroides abscessus subsp. abscessus]|nr:Uncharacterised protein [Mycobacteroides abscessus subsp. abscessus]
MNVRCSYASHLTGAPATTARAPIVIVAVPPSGVLDCSGLAGLVAESVIFVICVLAAQPDWAAANMAPPTTAAHTRFIVSPLVLPRQTSRATRRCCPARSRFLTAMGR